MSERLKDKVAVITGAGGGIGRAMARLFASEGANVMCLDIDTENANETVRLIRAGGGAAEAYTVDLARRADVKETFAQIETAQKRVDILVNNAMWISYDKIADVTEEVADRMPAGGMRPIWSLSALIIVGVGLGLVLGSHIHARLTPEQATANNPVENRPTPGTYFVPSPVKLPAASSNSVRVMCRCCTTLPTRRSSPSRREPSTWRCATNWSSGRRS